METTKTTNYKKIYVGDTKLDKKTINKLIGIEEDYQAIDRMYEIVMDKNKREAMFNKFLTVETDLSYDWFRKYFEEVQAERKSQKQDFTPDSVSDIIYALLNTENNFAKGKAQYEPCAGTGSIFVNHWYQDRCFDPAGKNTKVGKIFSKMSKDIPEINKEFFDSFASLYTYEPNNYTYVLEEKSEATIPFLLFNMAIRGASGYVFHMDTLTRECKHIYFVYNEKNDLMNFSDITEITPDNERANKELRRQGFDYIWTKNAEGNKDEWK